MKTRIQTNGMNRFLPPALSNPGDASAVLNLRKRSESLCPIGTPQPIYTPEGEGHKLICIHNCYDGEHHITEDENGIYYEVLIEESGAITVQSVCIFEKSPQQAILSTQTIGNTLIILCPEHIYYLLYKEDEYLYLGERPEIPVISFYPKGLYPVSTPVEAHDFAKTYNNPTRIDLSDTKFYDSTYYSAFFQCQELAWEEHRFIQPILVRYAITLYDGSRLYASAPVMISQTEEPLQPYQIKLSMRSTDDLCLGTQAGNVVANSYKLMCKIHEIALANWKDVIRSIDIFVAPEATIFEPDLDMSDDTNWLYYTIETTVNNGYTSYWLVGKPAFDTQEIHKRYLEKSLFYKIASLDNWDKLTADAEFEIKSEVRPDQLVHEEILSVDNTTLLSTGAKISYIHNKRLHIANLTKRLFPGFPAGIYNVGGEDDYRYSAKIYIRTYLKSERGESQVVWTGESDHFYGLLSPLITYPDSNAYKMEIVAQTDTDEFTATFNLTPSKYEDRAEYLNPTFLPIEMSSDRIRDEFIVPSPQNDIYLQPNMLRVSEHENPFIFPAEMSYTISNSAITGVASITSALSEGQFGEFSIYLFTEEGIWALQNGAGAICYETQHQLNRIGFSADYPIVPLETGILFMTDKGIFAIQGSTTQQLLSFDEAAYESITPITNDITISPLVAPLSDKTTLSEFVKGSQVVYNPIEGELIFSRPDRYYSLIFHLASLHIYRSSFVFSHIYSDSTHLLGQDANYQILDLQKEESQNQIVAWISRPITLQAESYQRWREVCWRMAAENANLRLSIWGGNDAEGEFNLVARADISGEIPGQALLRQTTPPYKYFRLLLSGSASPDFHLSAIDISALIFNDNRLR